MAEIQTPEQWIDDELWYRSGKTFLPTPQLRREAAHSVNLERVLPKVFAYITQNVGPRYSDWQDRLYFSQHDLAHHGNAVWDDVIAEYQYRVGLLPDDGWYGSVNESFKRGDGPMNGLAQRIGLHTATETYFRQNGRNLFTTSNRLSEVFENFLALGHRADINQRDYYFFEKMVDCLMQLPYPWLVPLRGDMSDVKLYQQLFGDAAFLLARQKDQGKHMQGLRRQFLQQHGLTLWPHTNQ